MRSKALEKEYTASGDLSEPGKTRVLFIGNSELSVFGFRAETVRAMVEKGYDVTACFPVTEFGDGVTTAAGLGCRYIPVDMEGHGTDPIAELRLLRSLVRIIRQVRPGIVFTFTIKPNIYGGIAAARLGVPVVMSVTGLGTALGQGSILQPVTLAMYRIAARRVRRIFFQNRENEGFFARHHIADGRRTVLPGSGVNLDRFQPLPYPSEEDAVHFLFIGRVIQEKGIEQYIQAARIIREKYPEAVFHVLGLCTEERYRRLLAESESAGVVVYHGHQSDIHSFLALSSCTIHPTFYPEGMSNVLLETAASGRPMIASDRSGCREIVEDGVNGFLCRPGDPEDLAAKIERFLALPRQERVRMGLAGRAKVEREFDRQSVVAAYLREAESLEPPR